MQETECKKLLEATATLEKLKEEAKTQQDSNKAERECNDTLRATLMDKDLALESSLADVERLTAQLGDKEQEVKQDISEFKVTQEHCSYVFSLLLSGLVVVSVMYIPA